MNTSNILIYQTENGQTKIETRLEDETVWLTLDQMAELFQKSRSTINEHILNIYKEQELQEQTSMRKIGISDFSTKPTNYYNLDVIISVGYRVKSLQGTKFRQWATARLKEYIVKGFTINNEYEKFKEQSKNDPSQVEIHFVKRLESSAKALKVKKGKK